MGREALLAALGWLSISGVLAVNNFAINDQEGAESASRLYRHAPGAVYASAAPYGAYSFQIPTISVQKPAASKIIPVKESYQNANGYLQDSYGNRFVEALQSMKTLPLKPFPQQYVQLQELPAHFAQPLAAAPAHYHAHHKQAPQVFVGSHYRLPSPAQSPAAPAPTPLNQQFSFPHSGVYADTFKNLAPAAFSFGPHFGSVIHVPVRSVAPARDSHNNAQSSQDFSHPVSENEKHPSAQQQSTSHKAVYADVQPQQERYHDHHLKGEHKFQRFQEAPQEASHETYSEEEPPAPARQVAQKLTTKQIVSAVKETPISAVVNGKKTVVNVKTKPPLPLLDISLLEPLTFANPLVPQVQHFLPRISEATYHKLPELEKHEDKKYQKEYVVQKTKTYDSGIIKGKPKKPKKKQKVPEVEHHLYDDYIPAATARPTVTIKNIDESPEISYEINSPNYKETYKEQAVKYNKETNSEPVHYTYGTKTQKEPVHYSYTHSSKEPVHIKEVRYEGKGEGPKHLIYNIKPDDYNKESERSKPETEHSEDNSEDDVPQRSHHTGHVKQHTHRQETPTSSHHHEPEHREQEHHHNPHSDTNHNVHREQEHRHNPHSDTHHNIHREQEHRHNPHSDSHHNVHREQEHRHNPHSDTHHNVHREQEHRHNPHSDSHHNVHREQEHHHNPHSDTHHNVHREQEHQRHNHHTDAHHNDHREQEHHHNPHTDTHHNEQKYHKPSHQPHSVDVIPFQYEEDINLPAPIKVDPNQHIHREQQQPQPSPGPQQHSHPNQTPQHHPKTDLPQHETPSTHVHEKTKQVYIQEETPEEDDTVGEQVSKSMFGKEEDKEQDFENAYKNAAFGFPAYDKPGKDVEKDIYNPESYGIPHDHSTYNIDHSPFQQYQEQGDNFPKEMRINYQDDRNKLKEDYFLDYSVSKPESLVDRYKNKVNYYKLFKDQKPEKYTYAPHEDDRNKQKQSAKLTAIPYSYYPVQGDMKQFFAQYKAAPFMFEYDYSKGTPKLKDNSAHASRPFQRLMNTQFVEPQFQYGFEPIAIPRLLDSELAAMATNNFPKSEKPGTRKKIYKENFYIKKTSMSDAVPNS